MPGHATVPERDLDPGSGDSQLADVPNRPVDPTLADLLADQGRPWRLSKRRHISYDIYQFFLSAYQWCSESHREPAQGMAATVRRTGRSRDDNRHNPVNISSQYSTVLQMRLARISGIDAP